MSNVTDTFYAGDAIVGYGTQLLVGNGASPFLDAFMDKGRMRPLLEKIPIAICTEPFAGLFGAAAHAAKQAAAKATAPRAAARKTGKNRA